MAAVAFPSAVVAWEGLKKQRDSGGDPSLERKAGRNEKKAKAIEAKEGVYTVGRLVEDYITGYVVHHRTPANAKALASRLRRAVAPLENLELTGVSRSVAFELIQGLADGSVKQELGAAWEHAYDSGKLREDVPNWWRQILKGRLQSKGQLRDGVHKGTDKRVLTEEEIGRLGDGTCGVRLITAEGRGGPGNPGSSSVGNDTVALDPDVQRRVLDHREAIGEDVAKLSYLQELARQCSKATSGDSAASDT